ncbi:hypothetical protein XENORESO_007169 [Xenotaenia resolanae]|uniref:Uncharacterized protein n=1 Tax=Xenotaenia resolanae TaxID=208358 RepID=A0ABV0WDN0_9TELE
MLAFPCRGRYGGKKWERPEERGKEEGKGTEKETIVKDQVRRWSWQCIHSLNWLIPVSEYVRKAQCKIKLYKSFRGYTFLLQLNSAPQCEDKHIHIKLFL